MKASLTTETIIYIDCPHCHKGKNIISHLFDSIPRGFGPWSCDDCGKCYQGVIHSKENVELQLLDKQYTKNIVALVLPPQSSPVFFFVEKLEEKFDENFHKHNTYLYEEHTCPTNWLRNVIQIKIDDDNDPHGLFEYLDSRKIPFDTDIDESDCLIEKLYEDVEDLWENLNFNSEEK